MFDTIQQTDKVLHDAFEILKEILVASFGTLK